MTNRALPDPPFLLGLIQMKMSPNPSENLEKALERVEDAARRGARVVCLPELFQNQYFCQKEDDRAFDLAEPIPGPAVEKMSKVAAARRAAVLVSLFERRAPGLHHNSLAAIAPDGSLAGVYRKMHVPDDPGYYEKYYFAPGDLGFKSFDLTWGKVGTLICWDQWYPEAARLTALLGAAVIAYPTAIGWHPKEKEESGEEQREAWMAVQRGHAVANGTYVAAVNRVGLEAPYGGDGIEFWGTSFVYDPMGAELARASADKEETLIVEIDPSRIERTRRSWPFLRDRRVDAYGGIGKRFLDEVS